MMLAAVAGSGTTLHFIQIKKKKENEKEINHIKSEMWPRLLSVVVFVLVIFA